MILINLLPHREEKRKRRKAAYFTGLALGAMLFKDGNQAQAHGSQSVGLGNHTSSRRPNR